jgi:tRNA(Arg) A34 adenosine deaminase TadA
MHDEYLRRAIEIAHQNVQLGGRPFGAVIVRAGQVLAEGVNQIAETDDPTSHAEMEAIRSACRAAQRARLEHAVLYASGHPCPMCLAAMHFAGIERAYYAYDQRSAEPFGLSTEALYAELRKPLEEQSLPLVCEPVRVPGIDLYDVWAARSR